MCATRCAPTADADALSAVEAEAAGGASQALLVGQLQPAAQPAAAAALDRGDVRRVLLQLLCAHALFEGRRGRDVRAEGTLQPEATPPLRDSARGAGAARTATAHGRAATATARAAAASLGSEAATAAELAGRAGLTSEPTRRGLELAGGAIRAQPLLRLRQQFSKDHRNKTSYLLHLQCLLESQK